MTPQCSVLALLSASRVSVPHMDQIPIFTVDSILSYIGIAWLHAMSMLMIAEDLASFHCTGS